MFDDDDDDGPSMGEEAQYEMALNWGNPYADHEDEDEDRYVTVDEIKAETDKAWGFIGANGKTEWLPKSVVTLEKIKGKFRFQVPGWLAAKKDNVEFDD